MRKRVKDVVDRCRDRQRCEKEWEEMKFTFATAARFKTAAMASSFCISPRSLPSFLSEARCSKLPVLLYKLQARLWWPIALGKVAVYCQTVVPRLTSLLKLTFWMYPQVSLIRMYRVTEWCLLFKASSPKRVRKFYGSLPGGHGLGSWFCRWNFWGGLTHLVRGYTFGAKIRDLLRKIHSLKMKLAGWNDNLTSSYGLLLSIARRAQEKELSSLAAYCLAPLALTKKKCL